MIRRDGLRLLVGGCTVVAELAVVVFDYVPAETVEFEIATTKSWHDDMFTFQPLWTVTSALNQGVVWRGGDVA